MTDFSPATPWSAAALTQFADGTLDPKTETAMLLDAEIDPDLYRKLTLAVVESRRLRSSLAEAVAAPTPTARARRSRLRSVLTVGCAVCVGLVCGAAANWWATPEAVQVAAPEPARAGAAAGESYVIVTPDPLVAPAPAVVPELLPVINVPQRVQDWTLETNPIVYVVEDASGQQVAVPSVELVLTHDDAADQPSP